MADIITEFERVAKLVAEDTEGRWTAVSVIEALRPYVEIETVLHAPRRTSVEELLGDLEMSGESPLMKKKELLR